MPGLHRSQGYIVDYAVQGRLPWWLSDKESACQCRRCRFDPWVGKHSWRRKWQPTPVFLPGKSHRQRSLAGYSPQHHKRVGLNLSQLNNNRHLQLLSQECMKTVSQEMGVSDSEMKGRLYLLCVLFRTGLLPCVCITVSRK